VEQGCSQSDSIVRLSRLLHALYGVCGDEHNRFDETKPFFRHGSDLLRSQWEQEETRRSTWKTLVVQ
jgi:hypothetical protein